MLRLSAGAVFADDFEIRSLIAEGGMGTVYAAVDRSCGEARALKVLLPELVADEASRRRFAQEARIGAEIDSPHIPHVHRVGVDEETGFPWIAMDLLHGLDLRAHVARAGALPLEEARAILEPLAEALALAHAKGLVHRDLKPENVFLEEGTRAVKLLDFGVAKVIDLHRTSALGTSAIGSPLWMAPEQTSAGGRIAPSTDVFALGLLAFYVLTGRVYWRSAHQRTGIAGMVRELHVEEPDPASVRAMELAPDVRLPAGFDEWFARAVVRDPTQRFRDAREALEALRPVLAPRRIDRSSLAYASTLEVPIVREDVVAARQARRTQPMGSVPPPSMEASAPSAEHDPRASARPPSAGPLAPRAPESARPPPLDPPPVLAPSIPPTDPPPPLAPARVWPWALGLGAAAMLAAMLSAIIVWVLLTMAHEERAGNRPHRAEDDAPLTPTSPLEVAVDEGGEPAPASLQVGDAWTGSYACGDQVHNPTMRIASVDGDRVEVALRRDAAMDEETLSGTYDPNDGHLILRSAEGAPRFGFDGVVGPRGTHYRGRVLARGCHRFVLARTP